MTRRPRPQTGSAHATASLAGTSIGLVSTTDASRAEASARSFGSLTGAEFRIGDGSPEPIGESPSLGATLLDFGVAAKIADVWFATDRLLRIRWSSAQRAGSVWRGRQFEPGAKRLAAVADAGVGTADIGLVDVALLNPFLPLLLIETGPEDLIDSAVLLPFPSLCRGGAHYGELCSIGRGENTFGDLAAMSQDLLAALLRGRRGSLFRVAELEVDVRAATGAEPIFSLDVADWLASVIGVELKPCNLDGIENPAVRAFFEKRLSRTSPSTVGGPRSGACILSLPADALPTIDALAAPSGATEAGMVGSFLVARKTAAAPRARISMPPLDASLLDLQPRRGAVAFPMLRLARDGGQSGTGEPVQAFAPVAMRYVDGEPAGERQKASLLMPVGPGVPCPLLGAEIPPGATISVLARMTSQTGDGFRHLIESLALQSCANRVEVVAVGDWSDPWARNAAAAVIHRWFPERSRLVDRNGGAGESGALDSAAAQAEAEFLLVVDTDLILHDPRTLETLTAMAARDVAASAGCMIVRPGFFKNEPEVVVQSAGYFGDARAGSDRYLVAEIDVYDSLRMATYPVAANSSSLQMWRAKTVETLGGFKHEGAVEDCGDLASRALDAGRVHWCTSVVSATMRREDAPPVAPKGESSGARAGLYVAELAAGVAGISG